mmetsp:Transcript_34988/g.56624  ORF Transcript_34988/g.56624 Transcript_34988/m.56624 type:complete len:204 (-) Transcript_34988:1870-2481(-)
MSAMVAPKRGLEDKNTAAEANTTAISAPLMGSSLPTTAKKFEKEAASTARTGMVSAEDGLEKGMVALGVGLTLGDRGGDSSIVTSLSYAVVPKACEKSVETVAGFFFDLAASSSESVKSLLSALSSTAPSLNLPSAPCFRASSAFRCQSLRFFFWFFEKKLSLFCAAASILTTSLISCSSLPPSASCPSSRDFKAFCLSIRSC